MAEPVVTPPFFARPSIFRDFSGVSNYLRELHRTLVMGLGSYANAINTGVAQYGTWTPAMSASPTPGTPAYDTQLGLYTLRGADCTIWGEVDLSGWTGSPSGAVRITGLPFAASSATGTFTVPLTVHWISGVNLTANYTAVALQLGAGNSFLSLREMGDNVSIQDIQASALSTTPAFRFAGTYRTNLT